MTNKRHTLTILAVLVAAALLGVLGALLASDEDRTTTTPTVTTPPALTVPIDGPDADRKPDDELVAAGQAPAVVAQAERTPEQFDLSGDLRGQDDAPAGVPTPGLPLAAQNWPGCSTRFLPTNFSSRRGQRIRGFGLHYTAGGNRPGLSDMDGLTAFASRSSAGVSWHFLIDREGHCYYNVPAAEKAWTIGNLNGQTLNVEMIGRGNEPDYGGTAGLRKLASVVQRASRIYGFPIRLGAVSNCQITRPGIVTHWMGGPCSGGHHDIRPYAIERVIEELRGAACSRACDLRKRNRATHAELKRRSCAPIDRTRSSACVTLHRRHRALHKAAESASIRL